MQIFIAIYHKYHSEMNGIFVLILQNKGLLISHMFYDKIDL